MNGFFSKSREFLRNYWPLLLSHHPSCPSYQNHTLNFSKIRLCIGCFIGYPSALLSILLGIFYIYPAFTQKFWLLLIGISLFMFQLLSLTKLTEIKLIKIIQKFSIGFGVGLVLVVSYYWFRGSVLVKLLGVWGVILIFMGPIGFLHYRNLRDKCENCPDRGKIKGCLYYKVEITEYSNNGKKENQKNEEYESREKYRVQM